MKPRIACSSLKSLVTLSSFVTTFGPFSLSAPAVAAEKTNSLTIKKTIKYLNMDFKDFLLH
jgi:hypothetical protein